MMTTCPQCGASASETQRFCAECGTRLQEAAAAAPVDNRNAVLHRPGGTRPDPFDVSGDDDGGDDDFFSRFTPKSAVKDDAPLPSRRSRRRFDPRINDTGEAPSVIPGTIPNAGPPASQPAPPAPPARPAPSAMPVEPPTTEPEAPAAAPQMPDWFHDEDAAPPTAAMTAAEFEEASAPLPPAKMPTLPNLVVPQAAAAPEQEQADDEPAMPDWFNDLVADEQAAAQWAQPAPEEPGAPAQEPVAETPAEPQAEEPLSMWGPSVPAAPKPAPADDADSATFTQLIRGLENDPADRPIASPDFDKTGLVPTALPGGQAPQQDAEIAPPPPRDFDDASPEIAAARERAAAFWGAPSAARDVEVTSAAEQPEDASHDAAQSQPEPSQADQPQPEWSAPADEPANAVDEPADDWQLSRPVEEPVAAANEWQADEPAEAPRHREPFAPVAGAPAWDGDQDAFQPEAQQHDHQAETASSDDQSFPVHSDEGATQQSADEPVFDDWFHDLAEPDAQATAESPDRRDAPVFPAAAAGAAAGAAGAGLASGNGMPALPNLAGANQSANQSANQAQHDAPAFAPASQGTGGSGGGSTPPRVAVDDDPETKRKGVRTILIAAAAAVVLIAGAFGASALFGGGGNDEPQAGEQTTEATTEAAPSIGGEVPTEPATPTPTLEQFEPVTFSSGSGNIRCQITPESGAICQIIDRNFTLPAEECNGPGYSGAVVGVNGEGLVWPCLTGNLGTGEMLAYDEPITAGQYTCTINFVTGATCSNGKGDSFTLEFTDGITTNGATAPTATVEVSPAG